MPSMSTSVWPPAGSEVSIQLPDGRAAPLRTTQSSETHGLSRGTVPCQPSLAHHVTVSLAQGLPLGIADIRAWLLSVMGHPGRCGVLSSTPALIPSIAGTPAVVTITDVFRQCSLGAGLP